MQVKELLSKKGNEIITIEPDATVFNAIKKMSDHNIGALVVSKGEKMVGIISERDYRNKVILKGRTSRETKVHEIMTDEVYRVSSSDTINLCMQLMTEKKIRHLPVIDNDKLVGIISIGDVVKSVIEKQEVEINSLRNYIGGGYPG